MPADGEVVEGRSHVDESMVTGESKPAAKRPGDSLISGTVNCSGPLVMKVRCWPVGGAAGAHALRLLQALQSCHHSSAACSFIP